MGEVPAGLTFPLAAEYRFASSWSTSRPSGVPSRDCNCFSLCWSVIVGVIRPPCRNGVGAKPLIVAAPKVGDVAEHDPPGQIARARSGRLELAGYVQVDLVLQDLPDHGGHPVPTAYAHKRPGPPIQGDHPLLNQGGELETPAYLVDDCFFLQIIEHLNFFRTTVAPFTMPVQCILTIRRESRRSPLPVTRKEHALYTFSSRHASAYPGAGVPYSL